MASASTTTALGAAGPLAERYTVERGTVYLSGLQALVRLPLDLRRHDLAAGRDTAALISGYEGSPLAGYDLELARQQRLLDAHGVVFTPGLNEELAANAVQGSQLAGAQASKKYAGVIGIWYGKAPGLDRASDALRHANLGGAHPEGGALVLVGDDSIAKSSTVPSSSEIAMAELGLPVLSPSDPQDILDLGVHGVAMSRFSGLWVGMKIATNVADGSATTEVAPDRVQPVIPDNRVDGFAYVHEVSANFLQPTLARLENSLATKRHVLAARYAVANSLNKTYGATDDAVVGIIVPGASYLDVRQALAKLGLSEEDLQIHRIRLLKLGLVSPLDADEIIAFADGLDEIIVVEEKRAFVESGVKDILYGRPDAPAVSGKTTLNRMPLLRPDADLDPELIAAALRRRLAEHLTLPAAPSAAKQKPKPTRIALPLLARTPYFCSGCPHNRSTRTPDGSMVGAGIGCSGMVAMMPSTRVGDVVGLTQMGGEGGPWIGMHRFVETPHMLQNMGDGTFHHSGSLAIRAAVASGANITYKILYNSAVAMTGGQDAVGQMTVPEIVAELRSEGVGSIVITTEDPKRYRRVRLPRGVQVRHRDALVETQEELARIAGVTALIHDQECATELRRKRKRKLVAEPAQRAFINERVCEGCGDCGAKSNCLSVQPVGTEYGRKTQIHQASCNKDYSCLDGDCPSFLTVVPAATGARTTTRRVVGDLAPDALPAPGAVVPSDEFGMRITGIGGTGVVTAAQIIATAASRSGRFVRTLDQTGLAQKGGAVVSDVKISTRPLERANKIARGEADLYLGCDVLVAAGDGYLGVASPDRTVAVVSTAEVPTGAMVTDTSVAFPDASETAGRIEAVSRPEQSRFVDARRLTKDLFDDDQFANVFLVGVAFQLGALPLDAEHLEEAIGLNGVQVERNIQAFRRGRQLVSDPGALQGDLAALTPSARAEKPTAEALRIAATVHAAPGGELAALVLRRVTDLIAYQDGRYATAYAELVERVRAAEAAAVPGAEELALATAQHLHKLMAYKDEYEVARLSLDPALDAALEAQFGPGYKASYRLHPPALRALGMKKKLTLGRWFRVVFVLLRMLRRLRGTPLDVFGYARVRRTERALIMEYRVLVDELAAGLRADNHELAVQIASLPDMVRGYEEIKERNVEAYHQRLGELRAAYGRPPVPAAS
ncbi:MULTISPECIES: indolepyruvate ferredoxin oxidoreductase family protein [unclassified Nocardioides]|uniref:indolepyruvate ferredoxin oxidoreductase family protein n=1 Tax=unclassified Nocardioides TaxID=2615069 RepID=UPI0000570692|nr:MULTISPECIES: indolepyruvate ferredoxin oxidoreductase family protein [unclassified Nocardioides]ABL81346.1 pyruvate ferredoxin/flavodoxin oxidoreductase [Nocardioides sp. JS614]